VEEGEAVEDELVDVVEFDILGKLVKIGLEALDMFVILVKMMRGTEVVEILGEVRAACCIGVNRFIGRSWLEGEVREDKRLVEDDCGGAKMMCRLGEIVN